LFAGLVSRLADGELSPIFTRPHDLGAWGHNGPCARRVLAAPEAAVRCRARCEHLWKDRPVKQVLAATAAVLFGLSLAACATASGGGSAAQQAEAQAKQDCAAIGVG